MTYVKPADIPEEAWRPVTEAHEDGTVMWGRNKLMKQPVRFRWGEVTPAGDTRRTYLNWRTEFTLDPDGFFHTAAGQLILPDEWAPHAYEVEDA